MLLLDINIESISFFSNNLNRVILEKIHLKIERGFIYSILGKNGSGKSTLIKSMTNLLFKNNYEVIGKVIFEGTDLLKSDEVKLNQIRKKNIRYVFQDTINSFDPLKKLEYYLENFADDKLLAEQLLKYFLLPSYDKIKTLYPYELSGGMSQRLSFIFAFIAEPDLIILDEPTSGIDHAVINLVLLKLKEFTKNQDKAVIIVTQDLKFARIVSDFISMIDQKTLTPFLPSEKFFNTELNENHKTLLQSAKEID